MARKSHGVVTINKRINAKVKEARIAKGWTRVDLAARVGVSHQQLQKYDNGSNNISAGRLELIAIALGKPVAWFYDGCAETENYTTASLNMLRNFSKLPTKMQMAYNRLIRVAVEGM